MANLPKNRQRWDRPILALKNSLGYRAHWQRSASATLASASSTCSPQPSQVGFEHELQVTFEHIFYPSIPLRKKSTAHCFWSNQRRGKMQKPPPVTRGGFAIELSCDVTVLVVVVVLDPAEELAQFATGSLDWVSLALGTKCLELWSTSILVVNVALGKRSVLNVG